VEGCRDLQFLFNLSQRLLGSSTVMETEARPLGTEVAEIREELLKVVYEIERSSFPEPYPYYFFAAMARETPETFLVAISGRDIVGYVLTSVNRDAGHVLSIAVRENFRRKGIGSRLMNGIGELLRNKGVLRINLEVRKSNLAAKAFYQKLGFQETGLVNAYYRDGEDAVRMTKILE
jgi:ribosomal-protein-alanine N-acetyltransferase